MLIAIFCLCWLGAVLFPGTPLSRLFLRVLVQMPAGRLSRLTVGQIWLALTLLIMVAVTLAVMKGDGALILAQGMPEGVAWLVTFDVASYLDLIAIAVLAAATIRVRALRGVTRNLTLRSLRRPGGSAGKPRARGRSSRPRRPLTPPASDGSGWLGLAIAA